jgi:peptidoglycan/LPS O-acetylase OafA/YrhL
LGRAGAPTRAQAHEGRAAGTEPAGAAPVHLRPLTGLRFLAALLVVLYHVGLASRLLMPPIVGIGYVGVGFFFVLSGFILTYTYLDANGQLSRSRDAFWGARIARVYPVYLVAYIIAVLPFVWHHDPRAHAILTGLSTLTLTQAWLPWSADAWNGPGWSLSCEAFFYLLFPVIAIPIARLSRRRLGLAVNLFWLAALAGPLLYIAWNPDGLHTWGWADSAWIRVVRFAPLIRLPEFLMGVALGRMFVIDYTDVSARGTARLSRMGLVPLIALVGICVVPCSGVPLPYILLHDGLLDPLFGLLIYGLAWNTGRVATCLAMPAMVALGEASYALYILHVPLRDWLGRLISAPTAGDPRCLVYWSAYLCLCIAFALLTMRFVEQPARRAIRRAIARG